MADIAKLKTELAAGHPGTGAYDPDAEIAAGQLNAVNRTKPLTSLSGDTVFAATNTGEFTGLTDHKQATWVSFCSRATIDPFSAANIAFVDWIFGDASATLTALAALRTVPASRAVEQGIGDVTPGDVQIARAN